MVDITFHVSSNNAGILVSGMLHYRPMPLDENGDPLYTNLSWCKQIIKEWVAHRAYEYRYYMSSQSALDDPDIINY